MNLFFTVVVLFCQDVYPVSQGGPKCHIGFGPQRHMRTSDVRIYETFVYKKCKSSYPQGNGNVFVNCENGLHEGCKYVMNNGSFYNSALTCEKL